MRFRQDRNEDQITRAEIVRRNVYFVRPDFDKIRIHAIVIILLTHRDAPRQDGRRNGSRVSAVVLRCDRSVRCPNIGPDRQNEYTSLAFNGISFCFTMASLP